MSGPPVSVKRSLGSCSNPSCGYYGQVAAKAPLKCSKCKSAKYCDKNCQRAHWPQHKEYCKVWADSSANNGEVPVAQIKLKMAHLIWLVRGMPEYAAYMFKEYAYWKTKGKRGCMEFQFDRWEELYEAIKVIEAQPIYEEVPFCGMPGSPSYAGYVPGEGSVAIKLPRRRVKAGEELQFVKAVDDHMHFTTNENRPNLQRALDLALKSDNMFVVSVTVELEGTYSTHLYDFIYRNTSWVPDQ
ncbi:hypothetical protein BV25DRAFT_1886486 [Artomyces pyxidatus]|uniref:Uncharacterized protein n=1 Tax=Artomyces pyxidatus TaxID=48021 RepID=A0ACB8T0S7_9AGAM|nr:hypothetical protein BV25DRAFT_1886486 [Artomyces pyxidatus]